MNGGTNCGCTPATSVAETKKSNGILQFLLSISSTIVSFFQSLTGLEDKLMVTIAGIKASSFKYKCNRGQIRQVINTFLKGAVETIGDSSEMSVSLIEDILKSPDLIKALSATMKSALEIKRKVAGDSELLDCIRLIKYVFLFEQNKDTDDDSVDITSSNDRLVALADKMVNGGKVDSGFRKYLAAELAKDAKHEVFMNSGTCKSFECKSFGASANPMTNVLGVSIPAAEIERLYGLLQQSKAAEAEKAATEAAAKEKAEKLNRFTEECAAMDAEAKSASIEKTVKDADAAMKAANELLQKQEGDAFEKS